MGGDAMSSHYDFAKMKGEKTPYIKHLKQPVTIRLDKAPAQYLKKRATELGMPSPARSWAPGAHTRPRA